MKETRTRTADKRRAPAELHQEAECGELMRIQCAKSQEAQCEVPELEVCKSDSERKIVEHWDLGHLCFA